MLVISETLKLIMKKRDYYGGGGRGDGDGYSARTIPMSEHNTRSRNMNLEVECVDLVSSDEEFVNNRTPAMHSVNVKKEVDRSEVKIEPKSASPTSSNKARLGYRSKISLIAKSKTPRIVTSADSLYGEEELQMHGSTSVQNEAVEAEAEFNTDAESGDGEGDCDSDAEMEEETIINNEPLFPPKLIAETSTIPLTMSQSHVHRDISDLESMPVLPKLGLMEGSDDNTEASQETTRKRSRMSLRSSGGTTPWKVRKEAVASPSRPPRNAAGTSSPQKRGNAAAPKNSSRKGRNASVSESKHKRQSASNTISRRRSVSDKHAPSQVDAMRNVFQTTPYPDLITVMELEEKTGLSIREIKNWFQSERRKMKRRDGQKNLTETSNSESQQAGSDPLPSTSGSHTNTQHTMEPEREPEPIPSTSTSRPNKFTPNVNRRAETSKGVQRAPILERIESRMTEISTVPIEVVMQELINTTKRVKELVRVYMKHPDFRKTFLTETRRLKEMSVQCSPFTPEQTLVMNSWRKNFFKDLMKAQRTDETRDKLRCAEQQVATWHPVIIYGKLVSLSLEAAITDFTFKSKGRGVSEESLYIIPSIMRYFEIHF